MSAQSTPSNHIFPSLPKAHTLPPATPSITTIRPKQLARLSGPAKEYNNQPKLPLFREEMSKIQNIIYNSAPKIQNGILNLRYYIVQGPQAAATLTELRFPSPGLRAKHATLGSAPTNLATLTELRLAVGVILNLMDSTNPFQPIILLWVTPSAKRNTLPSRDAMRSGKANITAWHHLLITSTRRPTTPNLTAPYPIAIIIKQRAHQPLVDGLFLCLTVCVSIALEREFNCGKLSISATYSLCP